jgi:zinc protease
MDLDQMYTIFRERFSNGGDFIFYFIGNIDIEKSIPLIEKYIGGIPSTNEKETFVDKSSPFANGIVNETVYAGMDEKSKFTISTCKPFEWNENNLLAVSVLNSIVKIKLTEEIREKLGGTYGVGFSLSPQKFPQEKIYMNIQLGCEPKRVEELTTAIFAILDNIMANGPTAIDLEKAKNNCVSKRTLRKKQSSLMNRLNSLYE